MSLRNTNLGPSEIERILEGKHNLFFAGIGGISMYSLAHISHVRGFHVSGYDRTPSDITRNLEAEGIRVYYEPSAEHVKDCDMLIYTVAMSADNPEYAEACRLGIPCVSRADFFGWLMTRYPYRIGISGMHGKSTTTSMTDSIFKAAGADATVLCGAELKDTGMAYRIGNGDHFIFEACEYKDSFLNFYPTVAVVMNVEMDHVDYFKSIEQIETSYHKFMCKTGETGCAVVNADDDNVMRAAEGYPGRLYTFGITSDTADYRAVGITLERGCASFDIVKNGALFCRVKLNVPGMHSVYDALAAAASADICGIQSDMIVRGLDEYSGVARRMDYQGKTSRGADIFNDYGHHPTEIATTLDGVRQMGYSHVYCAFQSHTYSRTSELFDNFVASLAGGADTVVIAPIYSARDTNIYGVSEEKLAGQINSRGTAALYLDSFEKIAAYLDREAGEGDVVVVMGAGDIPRVTEILTEKKK